MSPSISIRSFLPGDTMALVAVYRDAIARSAEDALERGEHEALLRYPEDIHSFRERLARGLTLVAVVDDEAVAFGQLEPADRIAMLYCTSAFSGQGVASSLYWILEAHAVFLQSGSLKVEANRSSQAFFERLGFRPLESERLLRHGVEVERVHMLKDL